MKQRNPGRHTFACVLTVLAMSAPATADDIVIPPGSTVLTTQTISGTGDTLTVDEGGAIDTTAAGGNGVDATADDQIVTNFGAISTAGTGIRSTGNNATIYNYGSITASTIQTGIRSNGDFAMIDNSGSIIADSYGIRATGSNATIHNSGTINSINHGIRSDGDFAEVVNTGTVDGDSQGTVVGIHAIRSGGQFADVTNYGTLLAGVDGIFSIGDNAAITNYGTITPGGWGIGSQGDNSVVVNAGTILAGNATGSINLVGVNSELVLLPGSVLEGIVGFYGINESLSVGNGLNLYLNYDGAFAALNSAGPSVHDPSNQLVITVDPTGFATAPLWLQTITGVVHNSVLAGSAPAALAGNATSASRSFAYGDNGPASADSHRRGWGSAFGGYQSQSGSNGVTGADQGYGGIVTGGDAAFDNRRYGAFAGGAFNAFQIDFDAQDIDVTSVFGGFYVNGQHGAVWYNATLAGGYAHHSSQRQVANNTVAGGLETAEATYDGYFISPSLTIGRAVTERTSVSVGGHYAGLFLDGYEETGSAANLTVDNRSVHIAALRAQATFQAYERAFASGSMAVETWIGIDGYFNLGDNLVDATVAGLPLSFEAAFSQAAAIGFAGIGFNHDAGDGNWRFGTSLEGRLGADDYREIRANATAALRF